MRGLTRQVIVVCSLASVSVLAVALYTTLYQRSVSTVTLDCTSVYSQPTTATRSGAAQQLTEPRNEHRSDAVHSDTVSLKGRCNNPACTLDRETVLDHSKCPLNRPFLVYIYNTHLPNVFELKYPSVLTKWEAHLNSTKTVTSNPSEACVFIAVVGPLKKSISKFELESKIHSLSHWNNGGVNHLLIDLSETGHTSTVLNELNLGKSIIATSYVSHSKQSHHILAPPILPVSEDEQWSRVSRFHALLGYSSVSILPVRRELFVYFEGQLVNSDGDWRQSSRMDQFRHSAYHLTAHIHVQGQCGWAPDNIQPGALDGEWALCHSWLSSQSRCCQSNFSLILGGSHGRTGAVTYARLISSLRCGSIPVVIGVERLPFDGVINWNKAAISLPTSLMTNALAIMASMSTDEIMWYRKQGRFLFETYFSSHRRILDSIIAIVRYKFFHPPPLAPDFTGTPLVTTGKMANNRQSNLNHFRNPISVYTEDLWNQPPGPFYMYPVTLVNHHSFAVGVSAQPTTSGTKTDQLLQAGFTGATFRERLWGNHREEMFTVVTITYHRNDQLMKMLALFEGCPYLAKVVVVWNNEEDPPSNMTWPDIGVPVEVVRAGRNSLNNRFLPLTNIQTEAILSLDDDIVLTHEEIEFAFRVWRENRDAVVGWTSRFHRFAEGRLLYSTRPSCEVSMVITNAAFIHKYYSYVYSYWMPQKIREMVDERMNCEDIAMNFLIAHISKKPPIKVGVRRSLHSGCKSCDGDPGLSSSRIHYLERDLCMNVFAEVYGYVPLLHTQFRADPILPSRNSKDGLCFELS